MVKMADRIVNLGHPPSHWTDEKIQVYREEAKSILKALKSRSKYLARRLERKIKEYESYVWISKKN